MGLFAGLGPILTKAAPKILGGLATAFGGMIGQRRRNQRAMEQQSQLMDQQLGNQQTLNQEQFGYQQQLNQQGADLQYQMWKDTNAPAQVGMYREAGLNPALMYDMAGSQGVTGSQGGGSAASGSAAGGNAPMQPEVMMDMALVGAQLKKIHAEIENTKADTKKKGGELENLKANTEKSLNEAFESQIRGEISRKTMDDQIRIIRQKYIKDVIETEMLESKTQLNEKQIEQLNHKIYQEWAKVGFKGLDTVLDFLPKKMVEVVGDGVKEIKNTIGG
jgi:hypothetical protein